MSARSQSALGSEEGDKPVADEPTTPTQPATPPPPPAPAGPTPGLDQTIPGGRYIVDGIAVNAEGEPLDTKKR